ncbi:hypothetical protein B0H14DRAFT_2589503 [Mycena olivaceomarginata]|nr:hypothetical protein B0H14DRAFT_2589503 [Mycena olivaceomarginata]
MQFRQIAVYCTIVFSAVPSVGPAATCSRGSSDPNLKKERLMSLREAQLKIEVHAKRYRRDTMMRMGQSCLRKSLRSSSESTLWVETVFSALFLVHGGPQRRSRRAVNTYIVTAVRPGSGDGNGRVPPPLSPQNTLGFHCLCRGQSGQSVSSSFESSDNTGRVLPQVTEAAAEYLDLRRIRLDLRDSELQIRTIAASAAYKHTISCKKTIQSVPNFARSGGVLPVDLRMEPSPNQSETTQSDNASFLWFFEFEGQCPSGHILRDLDTKVLGRELKMPKSHPCSAALAAGNKMQGSTAPLMAVIAVSFVVFLHAHYDRDLIQITGTLALDCSVFHIEGREALFPEGVAWSGSILKPEFRTEELSWPMVLGVGSDRRISKLFVHVA